MMDDFSIVPEGARPEHVLHPATLGFRERGTDG